MEGWVGLVGWPIADTLLTKWSHVNHRSGADQGSPPAKARRPNHWATPPTNICKWASVYSYVFWLSDRCILECLRQASQNLCLSSKPWDHCFCHWFWSVCVCVVFLAVSRPVLKTFTLPSLKWSHYFRRYVCATCSAFFFWFSELFDAAPTYFRYCSYLHVCHKIHVKLTFLPWFSCRVKLIGGCRERCFRWYVCSVQWRSNSMCKGVRCMLSHRCGGPRRTLCGEEETV